MKMQKQVQIKDIVKDMELSPRMKVDWIKVYQYQQALKAGAEFPPIELGLLQGKLYLLDGWHRTQAFQNEKRTHITANIRPCNSKEEMFIIALEFNIKHGFPLTGQEKTRAVDKLKDLKWDDEAISQLMYIPVGKIEKFTLRVVTNQLSGKKTYLKYNAMNMARQNANIQPEQLVEVNEELRDQSPNVLLDQIISLVEKDLVNLEEKQTKKKAFYLFELLRQKLEIGEKHG